MSVSWEDARRQVAAKRRQKSRRDGVVIEIGVSFDIGCKWVTAFDERYEVCVYHGEQRKKEAAR